MKLETLDKNKILRGVVVLACLGLTLTLFILVAGRLDVNDTRMAFDWKMLWHATENGHVTWLPTLGYPPWDVILLLPLGFLSLSAGWGVIMFLTVVILLASVPTRLPRKRYWLAVILLMTANASLRNLADANVDALSIAGVLLVLYAYEKDRPYLLALSFLIITIKPQTVFLFLLVVAYYILRTKPFSFILKTAVVDLLVVVPSLIWGGRQWFGNLSPYIGLPTGISLPAFFALLGAPKAISILAQAVVVIVSLGVAVAGDRELSREKAALLVAASALVSSYAQGLLLMVILAIGVIPLFGKRPFVAGGLVLLYDLAYLTVIDPAQVVPALRYYWPVVVTITWLVFLWVAWERRNTGRAKKTPGEEELPEDAVTGSEEPGNLVAASSRP